MREFNRKLKKTLHLQVVCLLMTFTNSLEPDQDGQNVKPGTKLFDTDDIPESIFQIV